MKFPAAAAKQAAAAAAAMLLGGCAALTSTEQPRAQERVLASNLAQEPHIHCSPGFQRGNSAVFTANAGAISISLLSASELISKQQVYSAKDSSISALRSIRADGGWYVAWRETTGGLSSWKFLFVREDGKPDWAMPVTMAPLFTDRFQLSLAVTDANALAAAWNDIDPQNNSLFITHMLISRDGRPTPAKMLGRNVTGAFYQGPALAPAPAGGYYLAFRQVDRDTDRGVVLGRYTADSEDAWHDFYDVPDRGKYSSAPVLVNDSDGGAVVAWEDGRAGNMDVFAQRVSRDAAPLWDSRGVGVAIGRGNQWNPRLASDGKDGFYFVWLDDGSGSQWRTVVQRLGPDGNPRWAPIGITALASDYKQYDPAIGNDGDDLIATWEEARWGLYQVFAQEFDRDGKPLLGTDGYLAAQAQCSQRDTALAAAGGGALALAWKEYCEEKWKASAVLDEPLK